MNDQEKNLLVLAHALAYQENEIQYLKALLLEKTKVNFDDFQKEQDKLWTNTKNYRIHQTLKHIHAMQGEVEALPEGLDLNMYMDHLRWPTDPPRITFLKKSGPFEHPHRAT